MRIAFAFAITAALVVSGPAAQAKKKKAPPIVYSYEYAIPFTCGNDATDRSRALPGDYAVAIDIYSPRGEAHVDQRVLLTFPPGGQLPGYASDVISQTVPVGSGIQVSCDDLRGSAFLYQDPPPATTFVQGLFLLTSLTPVHVFATRTVQGVDGGLSMQTEPIGSTPVVYWGPSPEAKVTICHEPPGNAGNAHTITVGTAAWPAHQAHGDTEGACR
ncbi:MAG: hypothetical protein DCC71_01055 [Proteobacteria bacterium]|nr:MAG: hypothetical protein DCC71_01055 [Pseudomonadota bacterium]